MKIDDVMKKYDQNRVKREQRNAEIKDAQQRLNDYATKTQECLANEDRDGFMKWSEAADKTRMELAYLNSAAVGTLISQAEINTAWKEYADDHEKKLEKKYAAVIKARKDLRTAFEDVLRFQNEALKVRKNIAELTGEDRDSFVMAGIPNEKRPIPGNMRLITPEARYMIATGQWNVDLTSMQDPAQDTFAITENGEPVEKLHF